MSEGERPGERSGRIRISPLCLLSALILVLLCVPPLTAALPHEQPFVPPGPGPFPGDSTPTRSTAHPPLQKGDALPAFTSIPVSPGPVMVPGRHPGQDQKSLLREPEAEADASAPGVVMMISVNTQGTGGYEESFMPSVTADGKNISFYSKAANLVAGDSNEELDIFVREPGIHTTVRVSVDSEGKESTGGFTSFNAISDDGRFIAFKSGMTTLVPDDTNAHEDIFVHDRDSGETTRISVTSAGEESNERSWEVDISGSGRYVAFSSWASNLVSGDTNAACDIFLHDRESGETTRISVSSAGEQANGNSRSPAVSGDGRYISYHSWASSLVSGDTNGFCDIFVHDRESGETTRVSVSSSGDEGNGHTESSAISMDGRFVSFQSLSDNLVPGDTNGKTDIFLHDRESGETTRISISSAGGEGNADSKNPSVSADGSLVSFTSWADNLVPGDTNGKTDIFLRNRSAGTTLRVSAGNLTGTEGNGDSGYSSLSGNGRFVAFHSLADNLVSGDTNGRSDVFVYDREGRPPPAITSITPAFGYPTRNQQVTITGTGFRTGAAVYLGKGTTWMKAAISQRQSSRIVCTLPTRSLLPGGWFVKAINPDGTSAQKYYVIRKPGPVPVVSRVTPSAMQSTTNTRVLITGSGFRAGAIVHMKKGPLLRKAAVTRILPGRISCTLPTNKAPTGLWSLKITNTDGTTAIKTGALKVLAPRKAGDMESVQEHITGAGRPVPWQMPGKNPALTRSVPEILDPGTMGDGFMDRNSSKGNQGPLTV